MILVFTQRKTGTLITTIVMRSKEGFGFNMYSDKIGGRADRNFIKYNS